MASLIAQTLSQNIPILTGLLWTVLTEKPNSMTACLHFFGR